MLLRFELYQASMIALMAATLLGACAIIPGPAGSGTGSVSAINRVTFGDGPERPGEQTLAVEAVRKVLERRGYQVVPDADFRVDVGLAKRAVEVGFRVEPSSADRGATFEAKPEDRRLDLCREHVFRLSLAIMDRRNGAIVYRGTAEEVRCGEPDGGHLLALARGAVRALTGGARVTVSIGKRTCRPACCRPSGTARFRIAAMR